MLIAGIISMLYSVQIRSSPLKFSTALSLGRYIPVTPASLAADAYRSIPFFTRICNYALAAKPRTQQGDLATSKIACESEVKE